MAYLARYGPIFMTASTSVRRATAADIPAIVEFSTALFAEDAGTRDPTMNLTWPARHGTESFGADVDDDASVVLCATSGETPVGYLVGRFRSGGDLRLVDTAVLESMYVDAAHRSRGVGATLIGAFQRAAADRGSGRMTVTAYAANERAIAFYRRNGFDPLSLTLARPVG